MKRSFPLFTFVVCLIIFLPASSNAQITLQIGAGGGISVPSSDYTGTTIDYYAGKNYGLASGFNVHGKARVGFGSFVLYGIVDYSSLSNSGESEPGQGKVEISQKITSIRVGPEYTINIPLMPITPYFGGNVALNLFSGETIFTGVSNVSSGTYTLEPASRLGFGVNGGVMLSLGPLMKLDIGLSYNFLNLSGKEYIDIDPSQDKRIDAYLNLNDEKDPDFVSSTDNENFIGEARSISSFQITATIMFGL